MLTEICAAICFSGLILLFIKPELISILLKLIDETRDLLKRKK